jgi:hypothetical protein
MQWHCLLLTAITIALAGSCADAQEHHEGHHGGVPGGTHARWHAKYYINWVNKEGKGCCNNQDCGELPDGDQRVTSEGMIEVRIHGVGVASGQTAWCPVLLKHYLASGNAPNWNTAHICVSDYYHGKTPCEQLICYQPKPMY